MCFNSFLFRHMNADRWHRFVTGAHGDNYFFMEWINAIINAIELKGPKKMPRNIIYAAIS
jgi:hypothetical protein